MELFGMSSGGCVPEVIACGVISDLDGDGAVISDLLSLLTDYGYVFHTPNILVGRGSDRRSSRRDFGFCVSRDAQKTGSKTGVVAANRLTLKHQPLFHPLDI